MTPALAVATAAVFVWLGMVLAISFMEAPVRFRAPDVRVRIGLGIGRLVFRALNTAEVVLATALAVGTAIDLPPVRVVTVGAAAIVVLMVQLTLVRPRLTRRSDRVLAGEDVPRSSGHYLYVALELIKVLALSATGILLLAL